MPKEKRPPVDLDLHRALKSFATEARPDLPKGQVKLLTQAMREEIEKQSKKAKPRRNRRG